MRHNIYVSNFEDSLISETHADAIKIESDAKLSLNEGASEADRV